MKLSKIMNSKLVKKLILLFEIIVINPLLIIHGFNMYLGDEKYSTDWLNTREKIKGFIKLNRLRNNSSISGTPFRWLYRKILIKRLNLYIINGGFNYV